MVRDGRLGFQQSPRLTSSLKLSLPLQILCLTGFVSTFSLLTTSFQVTNGDAQKNVAAPVENRGRAELPEHTAHRFTFTRLLIELQLELKSSLRLRVLRPAAN